MSYTQSDNKGSDFDLGYLLSVNSVSALCVLCGCDHETNHHDSESLYDRIKRFAVEGIGHGSVPRGATGKHDRSPDRPAAMKMNPIE